MIINSTAPDDEAIAAIDAHIRGSKEGSWDLSAYWVEDEIDWAPLGLTTMGQYRTGERRRWGENVWVLLSPLDQADDRRFAAQIYEGATENQDDSYEGVILVQAYTVTEVRWREEPAES